MKKLTFIIVAMLVVCIFTQTGCGKESKKDEGIKFKHAGKSILFGNYQIIDIYTLPNSLDYGKPVISLTLVRMYDTTFTKHYFIGHKLPKEMKVGMVIVFDDSTYVKEIVFNEWNND